MILGALPCSSTSAVTWAPSTRGEPIFGSPPSSPTMSTWSKAMVSPTSPSRRSTLTTWPEATRYCFPPVRITAYMSEHDPSAGRTTRPRADLLARSRDISRDRVAVNGGRPGSCLALLDLRDSRRSGRSRGLYWPAFRRGGPGWQPTSTDASFWRPERRAGRRRITSGSRRRRFRNRVRSRCSAGRSTCRSIPTCAGG